jgi:hypothetical protein
LRVANLSDQERQTVAEEAIQQLETISFQEIRELGRLVTRLLAELVPTTLALVLKLIPVSRLPRPSVAAIQDLGEKLHKWSKHTDLHATAGLPAHASSRDWTNWVILHADERDGDWLIQVLKHPTSKKKPVPGYILKAVAKYLRGIDELDDLQDSDDLIGYLTLVKSILTKSIIQEFSPAEFLEIINQFLESVNGTFMDLKVMIQASLDDDDKGAALHTLMRNHNYFQAKVAEVIGHVVVEGNNPIAALVNLMIERIFSRVDELLANQVDAHEVVQIANHITVIQDLATIVNIHHLDAEDKISQRGNDVITRISQVRDKIKIAVGFLLASPVRDLPEADLEILKHYQ